MRALRFVGLLVWASLIFSSAALADDAGPNRDVRTLRHDAPILLAARIHDEKLLGTLAIDGVVVNGDDALLQWHVSGAQRIDHFTRPYGAWWIAEEVWIDRDGSVTCCAHVIPNHHDGPTPSFLINVMHFPQNLVDVAAAHLSSIQSAVKRAAAGSKPGYLDSYMYSIDEIRFATIEQSPSTMGGYTLRIRFAPNDAPDTARLAGIRGRPPTLGESWTTPGSDGYFFFSGTLKAADAIHVSAGTTIVIWFPFVLDSSLEYSLTIANTSTSLGRIIGNLDTATNVVHFELPAFSIAPKADLLGEVDADPRPYR